ncbi:response regulator [Zavarzinia sp. CC-PAN008]|uniref:response regulator n=1 Tax=Zavarzinia sp. CC-PAN008 TaxID=3243332 RepID=UPI003F74401C
MSSTTTTVVAEAGQGAANPMAVPAYRSSSYNFKQVSVLVADNNAFLRSIVGNLCRTYGFKQIYECPDAGDAIGRLKMSKIDIVLTEWDMPGITGEAFIRAIRAGEAGPNAFLPIILLTGQTDRVTVRKARDSGVTEVLAKPISARTLLDRLIYVVEHPRDFIRTTSGTFFGPDRRRHVKAVHEGQERRAGVEPPRMPSEVSWNMAPEEVEAEFQGRKG